MRDGAFNAVVRGVYLQNAKNDLRACVLFAALPNY